MRYFIFLRRVINVGRKIALWIWTTLNEYFLTRFVGQIWTANGQQLLPGDGIEGFLLTIWKLWKYPLSISVLFLTIYSLFSFHAPTVSLPDELRLLQEDRLRMKLAPAVQFTDLPPLVPTQPSNFVPQSWDDGKEKEMEEDQQHDPENEERFRPKSKNSADENDAGEISRRGEKNEEEEGKRDANYNKQRELERQRLQREIIGSDRFIRGFNNRVQKPEDFYERNRAVDVKLVHKATSTTTTTTRSSSSSPTASSTLPNPMVSVTSREPYFEQQKVPNNIVGGDFHGRYVETTKNDHTVILEPVDLVRTSVLSGAANNSSPPPRNTFMHPVNRPVDYISTTNQNFILDRNVVTSTADEAPYSRSAIKRKKKRRRKQSVNGTVLSDLESSPYPPIVVRSDGLFIDRVRAYNDAIGEIRQQILKRRGYKSWEDIAKLSQLNVVWGNTDDFLERLARYSAVRTLILPWTPECRGNASSCMETWASWSSLNNSANTLIREYYEWSALEPLCSWIETPGFTKARWDAVYNRNCNLDISKAAQPKSLEFLYFYAKPINPDHYWPNYGTAYPSYFYIRPPLYVFYIHLLEDAIINTVGDVISGNVKIVPYTCSHDNTLAVPADYLEKPVYREVFIITQFWGTSFFHRIVEVMPRIAPYVDFLRANPNIQIHSPEDRSQVSEFLRMIGIDPQRIVTGVTRAKLAYLPQGTPCGFPDARSIQLLSKLLRDYIDADPMSKRYPRNRLILIRRSGLRRFVHQRPIEYVLEMISETYGLNFTIFADNPSPSLRGSMDLFRSAVLVVAPHGAGLANVVFSEPGTVVIEGVCNEPHVNMCYQVTAHVLGLHYHGLPSRGGCERVVDVMASDVENAAIAYLDLIGWKKVKESQQNENGEQ